MQNPAWASTTRPRIGLRPVSLARLRKARQSIGSRVIDVICFVIPFLFFFQVKIIGVVPGGEFLTLALVIPCLLGGWRRIWRGYNKPIFIMMGIWLGAQIISDFYNRSPFENAAKGEALITFFAINLMVLSCFMFGSQRRILCFAIGSLVGKGVQTLLIGQANAIWKFDYAPIVIPGVLLISCYFFSKQRYGISAFLTFALFVVNMSQDFRSQALITMIAGVIAIPLSLLTQKRSSVPFRSDARKHVSMAPTTALNSQTVFTIILVGITAFGVSKAYSYLASSGELGEDAQQKYETQSRGKLGLLVGGRPETFVAWIAVKDSPILGHGSWAEDPKYLEMLYDLQAETGYSEEVDRYAVESADTYLIPSHSHLMGAWVFSGILGAAFWVYIYYLVLITILWLLNHHPTMAPYYTYLMVNELWDILFSPFGQNRRLETAFLLVIICTILESTPKRSALRSPGPWRIPRTNVGTGHFIPQHR